MTGYTYKDLQDQVVNRFNNESIRTKVKAWINNSLRELYRKIPALWRMREDYFATTANVTEYALLFDFMEKHHVRNRTAGKEYEMAYFDYKDWLLKYPYNSASSTKVTAAEAKHYTIKGYRETDYYNTGTVTISGTTVTALGATLPADIANRVFQVNGEFKSYRISSRTSDTEFEIRDTYVNPSSGASTLTTASSYSIDSRQSRIIEINLPDGAYDVYLTYFKMIPPLVADNDVPAIPYHIHDLLVQGAIAHGAAYDEQSVGIIADARKVFEQGIYDAMMNSVNELDSEPSWSWSESMRRSNEAWPPSWGE